LVSNAAGSLQVFRFKPGIAYRGIEAQVVYGLCLQLEFETVDFARRVERVGPRNAGKALHAIAYFRSREVAAPGCPIWAARQRFGDLRATDRLPVRPELVFGAT